MNAFSQLVKEGIGELVNQFTKSPITKSPNDDGAATAAHALVSGLEALGLGA